MQYPSQQAAALTESREKAARERKKEVQERLKGLQDSDGVEFAGEIITTQAEITAGAAGETEVTTGELRHGEMEVTAGELRQPEIAGDTTEADTIEGEIAAVQAEIHGGEATLERTTDLSGVYVGACPLGGGSMLGYNFNVAQQCPVPPPFVQDSLCTQAGLQPGFPSCLSFKVT